MDRAEHEVEIRNRILVAVYAYAYEAMDDCLVDDRAWDALALSVRPETRTSYRGRDNRALDRFFREEFSPDTGLWVHRHPDKEGLKRIYRRLKGL